MWKWPLYSGSIIGVILLSTTAHAGEWRYSGAALAPSDASPPGAGRAISGDQRSPESGEMLPRNNMTQTAVHTKFGDPQEKLPAVGQPPISRWRYLDFTVYFERDRVIVSVPNDVGFTR